MSNQLDDRIRELYAELAQAAPPVPPLPDPTTVRSPWVARWPAFAAAATAAIVVLAAIPLLLGGEFFGASDEAANMTSVAAAETIAPPTTGVAAETTTAPESTGGPSTAVPDEVLLPALNLACRDFVAFAEAEFPAEVVTVDDYETVWGGVAVFSVTIDALAGDLFRAELTALNTTLAGGPGDDASQAATRLDAVVLALDDLTRALFEFGAADCASIGLAVAP